MSLTLSMKGVTWMTVKKVCSPYFNRQAHSTPECKLSLAAPAAISTPCVSLFAVDEVGRDFDFLEATVGEEKFHEVFGRLLGGLSDNVAKRVGERRLERHTLGLEASEVYAYDLVRLEHPGIILLSKCKRKRGRSGGRL